MRALRELMSQLATAIGTRQTLSRYICEGCELRDACHIPAGRRRLCWETRANRPRWWWLCREAS